MKIFCDTNIIIEYLCHRSQADIIEQILSFERGKTQFFISVGSFYTITFIVEKYLRKETSSTPEQRIKRLRDILLGILADFTIAPHTSSSLSDGVNAPDYIDLEDSYQYQAAIHASCDVLLTINDKDFTSSSSVEILTPFEFSDKYLSIK